MFPLLESSGEVPTIDEGERSNIFTRLLPLLGPTGVEEQEVRNVQLRGGRH